MKSKFASFLIFFILTVSMCLNAQIKLNESGFNDVQLGKNIRQISHVSRFSSLQERKLFQVFPSDTDLYAWQAEDTILFDSAQVRYVFLSADSNGVIVKISLWINDQGRKLESQLAEIYGEPKFRADAGIDGWKNRDICIWELSPDVSAFLAQPVEVDPTLKFRITKLDFFYPRNLQKISKHIIAPRYPGK